MTFAFRNKAINILDSIKNHTIFAWGCEVPENDFKMPTSLMLNEPYSEEDIQIPVMKKDLKLLEDVAEKIPISNWQIEWRIKGSSIQLLPANFSMSNLNGLVETSLNHLQIQFNPANIEANLLHLSLYRAIEASDDVEYEGDPDNQSILREKNICYPGSFATVILQIPVVGGYRGGELRLQNRNLTSESFSSSKNSHRSYYLTIFYDDCRETMETVTKGTRLELVFNLRYKTPIDISPKHLVEDVKSPLYRIWQQPISSPPEEVVDALSLKHRSLRELFDCWRQVSHQRVELYAIPLHHSYSKDSLSFSSLKGVDRAKTQLITSTLGDFVEIHLAMITKYVGFKEEDWCASGKEFMMKKSGKRPEYMKEADWTDYYAGHWVDREDRKLLIPPLSIAVPDEFLGSTEEAFVCDSLVNLYF